MGRALAAAAVLCAALGLSLPARAITDQDRWHAHQELTQAQDLKKQGKLQDALTHYQASAQLDPKLVTLLELAECEEQLGLLLEAREHWAAARDKAERESASRTRDRAEERRLAVEKRLAHLTLQLTAGAPSGSQISRDQVPVDAGSLGQPMLLNPGDHVIVVKAPEHQDASYPLKLSEGDNQTLEIGPGASTAPPPPPPPPAAAPPPPRAAPVSVSTGSGSTRRTLGMVAGAAGIVGIGVGIPFWYVGYRDGNSIGPTADNQLLFGQISVIAGGALLVTGVLLYATAPSSGESQAYVTPTLNVGHDVAVVGATGAF